MLAEILEAFVGSHRTYGAPVGDHEPVGGDGRPVPIDSHEAYFDGMTPRSTE